MKKLLIICFALFTIGASVQAQTTVPAKKVQKKTTTKHKAVKALNDKATQQKLEKLKQQIRKEGE